MRRQKLQGIGRMLRAFSSSGKGFAGAFREEAAFRQELLFACLALPLALWLGHSGVERALLAAPVLLILIVELLKGIATPWPRVESDTHIMSAGSARPLEDAFRIAQLDLVQWVAADYGLSLLDSYQFITQAVELHLDYIKLPPAINLGDAALANQYAKATVTIKPPGAPKTTKSGSPQVIDITIIGTPTPAGIAFVKYTLSPTGLAQYKQGGFTLITPTVTGDSSAVPSAVKSELGG